MNNVFIGPGRIRTYDQWIMSPLLKIVKSFVNKELTKNEKIDFATSFANLLQKNPELCQLIEMWPELPEHIKAAIKTLIETQDIEKLTTTKEGPVEL